MDALGVAPANVVNLMNPDLVFVGGWVGMRLMETLAERIEDAVRAHALQRSGAQFRLVPATFGGDTVALGAAILALEGLVRQPLAT